MSDEVRPVSRYHFKTGRHNIHVGDNEGNTPLHAAVKEERLAIVKTVLEYGCDINSRNNNHETSLHLAAKRQAVNIMHTLLTAGANPNIQDGQRNTAMHNFLQACSAEQWAKHENKTKIMSMLRVMLANGARSNIKNTQGKTCVHLSIKTGQQDMVELLMEDAKRKDIRVVSGVQWTVLGIGVVSLFGAMVLIKLMNGKAEVVIPKAE